MMVVVVVASCRLACLRLPQLHFLRVLAFFFLQGLFAPPQVEPLEPENVFSQSEQRQSQRGGASNAMQPMASQKRGGKSINGSKA